MVLPVMKLKSLAFACGLAAICAAPVSAATYNLGDVSAGGQTSQTLRVQSVDFIDFTLDAPGASFSDFEISVTSTVGSNFREMIGLYSGTRLVAQSARGAGNGGGTASLSFTGADALADGSYTLAIGAWRAFFPTDIAGARSTAYFSNGSYTAEFSPVTPVPLPAGLLLTLSGLGAFAMLRRKERRRSA